MRIKINENFKISWYFVSYLQIKFCDCVNVEVRNMLLNFVLFKKYDQDIIFDYIYKII